MNKMNNKIQDIFGQIHAEESLKQKAAGLLHDRISNRRARERIGRVRLVFVFAAWAVVLNSGILALALYFTPYVYIDMDINPSVEVTLNRFHRVVALHSYNKDSEGIISSLNIRHIRYEDAVKKMIDALAEKGYLHQNELLTLTVQDKGSDSESNLVTGLQTAVGPALKAHYANMAVEIFPVSEEIKSHAHERHISPAKYIAIIELQQVDPTMDFERCTGHSISKIRQLTHEHSEDHHDGSKHGDANTKKP